jgi:limiting CO2-inducible B/C-like protein
MEIAPPSFAMFHHALQSHFPGALPLADYVKFTCSQLKPFGFDKQNTLAAVAICRDEIAEPFLDEVLRSWGKPFDLRSLAGFVSAGKSGVATMLGHAPLADGVGRFVFYSLPHIAISQQGEVGNVFRDGIQQVSQACGSLIAILKELESGHINFRTDMDDIEQCTVRQKLLSAIRYGDKPDQLTITKLAGRIIREDVERLLRHVDSDKFRYAFLSGILIHGPADTHWVHPTRSFVAGANLDSGTAELTNPS